MPRPDSPTPRICHRVTLADVARAAGVHRTTVALALRNHPGLPGATLARLKSLARKMGYRPDPTLAALNAYRIGSAGRANVQTIAYLRRLGSRDDAVRDCHRDYLAGAQAQADLLGYRLEPLWLDDDGIQPAQLQRILRARGIRGVLLASFRPDLSSLPLDWERFCALRIGHHPTELSLPTVAHNYVQITRTAIERLHANGYRRIGLATSAEDALKQAQLIRAGFELGWQGVGAERVPPLAFQVDPPGGRPALVAEIAHWAQRERIDVLLSNWNFPAAEVRAIGAARRAGIAFCSLDAPAGDLAVGGMVQNHRIVGGRAIDQLAVLLHSGQTGLPAFPTLSLIDGYWRDAARKRAEGKPAARKRARSRPAVRALS